MIYARPNLVEASVHRVPCSIALGALTLLLSGVAPFARAADPPPQAEGLVEVKARHVDDAWLLPDTDFRQYTKVMIDPAEAAFRKNWLRDVNRSRGARGRVGDEDARKILEEARSGFSEVFEAEFREAGYAIATAPGPDVLRLSPSIVDLYVNAPDVPTAGRVDVYTVEAGEARLILEARDSESNAVVGVAIDRRKARSDPGVGWVGRMQWTTKVSNRSDFAALFRTWARISVKGLAELKEQSPVSAEPRSGR
jgi:hypothetical protein